MRAGDIIATKSITHREVVEMRQGKDGQQRPRVNQYTFGFQSDINLLSEVGVFVFVGVYPEMHNPDKRRAFVEKQLRLLGWTMEAPPAVDAVDPSEGRAGTPPTREEGP